ncbi:hypothetical protein LARI1_G004725 [Lachnellula arida]|uniref:Heterokaryon incompatibility domain-containing protein n=1 Tax=Lachnellula arida TaxID=1316785 RepID=A0A8T9BMX7_9HELO|nr:hypothetical protein LARI1_G004725 [Lachnellula arida]
MREPEVAIVYVGRDSSSASSEWETESDSEDSTFMQSPRYQITTADDHSFDHCLDDLITPTSDSPTSKLCTCCQEVVNAMSMYAQKFKWQGRYSTRTITYRQGLLALVASAEAVCDLCFAFINGLQYNPDCHARIAKSVQEWTNTAENTALPWGSLALYWDGSSAAPFKLCLEFGELDSTHDLILIKQAAPGRPIFQTSDHQDVVPNTSHSLPLAKKWLDACRSLHPACHNKNPSFVPTRLIDIRGLHPRLHLYQEFENNQSVQYATLSHCWGSPLIMKESCTLMKSTLPLFTSKISLEDLPKTFQDAIQVCKALEISYIWIDSLCIIQDDKEDRDRESVTMNNVYSNGTINIAASSASDGSVGCFFERSNVRVCQILIQIDDTTSIGYNCFPLTHPLESMEDCPLETRGWTFQERLLSPRTLHFTRTEVFWECFTKFVSEASPISSDRRIGSSKQGYIKNWATIVREYSSRKLTFKKDKLIALAGIAAAIQDQTRDKYYAGMWGRNLEWQLSWYLPDQPALQRTTPPRAPTWSWACFDQQDVAASDIHVLNLDDELGLLLRPTRRCPGEYQRVGFLYSYSDPDVLLREVAENRSFHAQENAYVPSWDHQFENHPRVIVLI